MKTQSAISLFLALLLAGCGREPRAPEPIAKSVPKKSGPEKAPPGKLNPQTLAPQPTPKSFSNPLPIVSNPPVEKVTEPPKPERELASATVPAKLTIKSNMQENWQLIVSGTSNLPQYARLEVDIDPENASGTALDYRFYPQIDADGNYVTEALGNKELGMMPYEYVIQVSLRDLAEQPKSVRDYFSDPANQLHGPLVEGKRKTSRLIVKAPLDLRVYDFSLPSEELRRTHAEHCEDYLKKLREIQAALGKIQSTLMKDTADPTIEEQLQRLKSELGVLGRDRKMLGVFTELNRFLAKPTKNWKCITMFWRNAINSATNQPRRGRKNSSRKPRRHCPSSARTSRCTSFPN